MSSKNQLLKLNKENLKSCVEVVKSSFRNDPLWERVFKGEADEDNKRLSFFEMPLRLGLTYGEVYSTSPELEGVSILIPGSKVKTSIWRMLRSGGLGAAMKLGSSLGSKLDKIFKPLEDDHKINMGDRDYLYISILGVDFDKQGQGFGGQLLKGLINISSDRDLPLYLETETEENVRFYEKFGFKVIKKINLPIVDHPMWEMLREVN